MHSVLMRAGPYQASSIHSRRRISFSSRIARTERGREGSPPPSPPSKMRSDYMTDDGREIRNMPGRTLLERTSLMRAHLDDDDGVERISSRNGRQRQRGRRRKALSGETDALPLPRRRRTENGAERVGRSDRPKKSRQELDDELDAFLNEKN